MKINFTASFNVATGYGNASVKMAKWLASIGNDVHAIHEYGKEDAEEIAKLFRPPFEKDCRNVNHCIPHDAKFDALWTIAEFTPVPFAWKYALDNARTVMTQSKFSKECLESVTSRPIEIVPNGIEMSFGLQKPKISMPQPDKDHPIFRFLSISEWVPRKQMELLIRTFCEEFKPEDRAELWIRSWPVVGNPLRDIPWIAKDYPKVRGSIYYIKNYVHDLQYVYQLFDSYVLPCAGEGFGLTFLEAMACGLKPIGPNHGGSLEFMNDKNSYLVDCDDWAPIVPFGQGMFSPDSKWRVPNKDALKKAMRTAYEKREKLTKSQSMEIKVKWSWESAARKMQKALEK
jgi:glycosyltransferase involved in cell wall biosynthesis